MIHLPRYQSKRDAKEIVVPDPKFDLLCKLTGEAHRFDVSINSQAEHGWRFSYAALRVVEHPYLQLLRASGFEDPPSTHIIAACGIAALLAFLLYWALVRFGAEGFAAVIALVFFGLALAASLRISRDAHQRNLLRRVEEARGKLPLNFKFR